MTLSLLIFGFGYSGRAVARQARQAGYHVIATSRAPASLTPEPGVELVDFLNAEAAIGRATHILATAAPDEAGDPVLARYATAMAAAPKLRWIGYLSTTGVYGNRDGGWVDEATDPDPVSPRARRRVAAEAQWRRFGTSHAVDIFRLAGIYGPGRSVFDDLRAGSARRVVKPGHLFSRIHVADIARGLLAAMQRDTGTGCSVFNFADDEPAASADVVEEAARLLGMAPPPPVDFAEAMPRMSEMALSFWSENRRVACETTKKTLRLAWKYPDYRAGLRGILAEEIGQGF